MVERANVIFADGPTGNRAQPDKSKLRAWGTWLESFITAIGANSGSVYPTRSALFADLARAASSMAWVVDDDNVAYNGVYRKSGASGAGSWSRVGDLPVSFITGTDVGAGTANAIKVETNYPVSESALIIVNVFRVNTGASVTISFNGGAALALKTSSGNNPSVGGLPAGMRLMGVVSGSEFRLVNDQASAAAAEASASAAAASQVAAAASASTANTRATASQTSATNSANSATASEASRVASGASATNSANSATASEASRVASDTFAAYSANSASASQTARLASETARTASEAARDASEDYATDAGMFAASASGSANTATTKAAESKAASDASFKWASEAENVQVSDGTRTGYSAYHWSKKAEGAAGGGVFSWAGRSGNITLSQAQADIAALPLAGGTLTGRLVALASTTAGAGVQLPHGVAPTTPVNGEVWTQTSGLFYRINGTTRQAYDSGSLTTMSAAVAQAGTSTTVQALTAQVLRAGVIASPVGTATQAALDAKADLASPAFTGAPTVPTPAAGSSTAQAANAAFVQSENSCKAWVNFNGTGTVAIRASKNVSSITDNGAGDYTVNFTTPLPDINYSAVLSGGMTGGSGNAQGLITEYATGGVLARTTTSFRLLSLSNTFNGADAVSVNAAFFR